MYCIKFRHLQRCLCAFQNGFEEGFELLELVHQESEDGLLPVELSVFGEFVAGIQGEMDDDGVFQGVGLLVATGEDDPVFFNGATRDMALEGIS